MDTEEVNPNPENQNTENQIPDVQCPKKEKCKKRKCRVPKIGRPAPEFEGMAWDNGAFKELKLSEFKGKWVILFFYPMDFTFVCPTEIISFSDACETFQKLNTVVIGASTDSQYVHREFALRERKAGGLAPLKIPLLADSSHDISMDYGCYIKKGENKGVAFRATYMIDPNGILRQYSMNDLMVGRSIDELIRLLQAFQFTDEHGEVCPMNWKAGKRGMKAKPGDPELKKYFEEEMAKGK